MSISQEQRKKLGLPQAEIADTEREQSPSIERLEEGQEVSPDVAERLQPQIGNLAVQALLSRTASSTQTATGTGDMELAEELGESVDEEYEGGELSLPDLQMGGGGGADGLPGEHMPWEVGFLFGGDDEPDAKPKRKRPRRRRELEREHDDGNTDPYPEDQLDDDIDHIEETMGQTPPMREEFRAGDARYRSIEAGLSSPHAIGRRTLKPETMVDRVDALDPLGRATAICGFLEKHAGHDTARVLAATVSEPAAILLLDSTGHAGATARMASLTVCAQAVEGGGTDADNAVRIALNESAWFEALDAARALAESGHVVAPEIVRLAGITPSGSEASASESPPVDVLSSIRLGQHALGHLLPESDRPTIPRVHTSSPERPNHDPDVAAVDALLAELTGGQSPADLPPENRLEAAQIAPILSGATEVVNQMGKAQVELAAAAIAVAKIDPNAPIRGILTHADRALRELARSVVRQGDELHRATGAPLVVLDDLPTRAVDRIRASAEALSALRTWSFNALSEALHR